MRSIVITGVSTGIGFAAAELLVRRGFRIFGSVRNGEDEERLQRQLGPGFRPLRFDVTDEGAVRAAASRTSEELSGEPLFALINNAGICVVGPLTHVPLARFREQMEVNLIGVLSVTQAFLPLMLHPDHAHGHRPRPCVVNVGSIAGKVASPFAGPYSASKFGLEGFSDSLRRELMLFGIDVVLLQPGPVVTPIWDKAEARVLDDYPGTPYERPLEKFRSVSMLEAKHAFAPALVAERIYRLLHRRRRRARYAIVPNRLINWTLPRCLPDKALDFCIGKFFGLI
ncbi:MAG: SDR family NAD(P)-dependent oxidoreductase [Verrucomicrobia bacterium]|nr:SDR family NAD(P)-dependent oxidoreductase [Verrucomicrobiota bacterium]